MTRWSLIQQCRDADDPAFREHMEILCGRYWSPAYFYIRRNWTRDPEEASDLCQSFFLKFLSLDFLESVDAAAPTGTQTGRNAPRPGVS